jgi:hypothetical protein
MKPIKIPRKSQGRWLMPTILTTWDFKIASLAISYRNPISKISRAKWTGGVAQAVEYLFCKHEALGSNPRPTKKCKKDKRRLGGRRLRKSNRGSE